MVFSNQYGNVWHKTLGAIWGDEQTKSEPVWKQYLEEKSTNKKYYDDVEMVDPGLWAETEEGADMDLDDFGEGIVTRYEPKKFAKRLIIPEELMEDAQYDQVYDAVRMLSRTCNLTQDYDAVSILNDAFNTAVTGGDGQAMVSASHEIRGGGTVSNSIAALTPSNTAVQTMLIAAEKTIGGNGFINSTKLVKLVGPTNYKFRFREILKSEKRDDTANNAINSIKGELSADYVGVPFMASSVDWFGKTNAMRGLMFVWRRKPRFRKSNNDTNETEVHTGSARWTKGWSNFRGIMGVDL